MSPHRALRARGRATRGAPLLLCRPDSTAQTMTLGRNAGWALDGTTANTVPPLSGNRSLSASKVFGQRPRKRGPDTFLDRLIGARPLECAAGDALVEGDVTAGKLHQGFRRDFRDRFRIGIATLRHPQPKEFLVQTVRVLPGSEPAFIGLRNPVAAGIRRVNLIGQRDDAVLVDTELVLGVDKDKAVAGGRSPDRGQIEPGSCPPTRPIGLGTRAPAPPRPPA